MGHKEIRKKFLEFFERNGHKIVSSSSLLPKDDSSVLLTTAGMQQFKPYYLENVSPYGNRVASIQKCFRTSDIEEVGDKRHLTFFEMLGNFSFKYPSGENSYFKEEAIKMGYDFIVKEMGLNIDYITVFQGDEKNGIPCDNESVEIWKKLEMPQEKIKFFGREDNFWGPTGNEGPCGPTTEIYVNGIEIWNIVFNEYYFNGEKYEKLKEQGIDTGMGLERLAMAVRNTPTIFETDLFAPIVANLKINEEFDNEKNIRIIADHLRGAVFLISDGLVPSNVGAGYVLRRLLRRIMLYSRLLFKTKQYPAFIDFLVNKIVEIYKESYSDLEIRKNKIRKTIAKEEDVFYTTLEKGLKELNKLFPIGQIQEKIHGEEIKPFNRVDAEKVFFIYQTYGFPFEMIQEELARRALLVNKEEFEQELKKHQEISRHGAENKFGGHGIEKSENVGDPTASIDKITKFHTATHLLQAALRVILGNEAYQMGSDINEERLRFDFSFGRRLTEEELKKVENLVNERINEGLEVKKEEMKYEEAIKFGALAFFKEKYPEIVTVYSVGNFSKEICGGPHIANTAELGKFKIIKEESSSAGVRRIKAVLN